MSASFIKVPPKATFARLKAREKSPGVMGKSDIQSWLASTSTAAGDEDHTNGDASNGGQWKREYVVTDWSKALEVARSRLLTSSTKLRTQFLREELLVLAKHGGEAHAVDMLSLVLTGSH